jgi:Photosynthetic reaction centre cytochrome C subunit
MNKQIDPHVSPAIRARVLLSFAAAFLYGRGAARQTAPPELREDQPAETVFKNIQSLKGMRAGDLQGAMSFIASSLNVDCDHCHVQDFSKDERKEKLRAREMIRMVRQINEESFQGKNTVNCFTCHQGHREPIAVAPIVPLPPRASKAEEASVAARKPASPALPSVEEVLNHYVQALGGQSALDGVKSRIIKTTRLNGGNSESITMMYQKGPGKALLSRESPSYSLWVGFNGTRAWAEDSLGSYWGLLNTLQRNAILRDAEIYQGSRLRGQYSDVKVRAAEKLGDQNTYVVSGTSPEGTSEDFYFNVGTGLLVRRQIEEQTVFGGFQVRADFEDYREIGGVKMPFVVRWSSPAGAWGTRTSFKVLDVQQNENIPDKKFEGPPSKSP